MLRSECGLISQHERHASLGLFSFLTLGGRHEHIRALLHAREGQRCSLLGLADARLVLQLRSGFLLPALSAGAPDEHIKLGLGRELRLR